MLSNILNNAVNAISPDENGLVEIQLESNVFGHVITVNDNGRGMNKEKLKKIIETAKGNKLKTNLGLPHAINFIEKIGGTFDIHSVVDDGTSVSISLPPSEMPNWFMKEYKISSNDCILVIDDCQSVHDVWSETFKKIPDIEFYHFYRTTEALNFFKKAHDVRLVIFCDYEFFEEEQNGIEVLRHAPDGSISFLVTSHLYDPKVMNEAINAGVNILPKDLIPYFQLSKDNHIEEHISKISLIFIDNDPRNTESWEFFAKAKKLKILTYNHVESFLSEAADLDKNIPVYIDLDLGTDKNGIDYAKDIYDAGFKTVFIATGALDMRFNKDDYYWITDIIEKRFPLL